MNHETVLKTMGKVEQFEVIMEQIPKRALYRLQANIMQEVKYRAHANVTNLEVGRGVAEMSQITCDQLNSEKEEEK
jgi:hypothetical protein